jgi:hypothetical protein
MHQGKVSVTGLLLLLDPVHKFISF